MTCSRLEATENRERERELMSEVHNLSSYWLVLFMHALPVACNNMLLLAICGSSM